MGDTRAQDRQRLAMPKAVAVMQKTVIEQELRHCTPWAGRASTLPLQRPDGTAPSPTPKPALPAHV